jgi:hypothetical protein
VLICSALGFSKPVKHHAHTVAVGSFLYYVVDRTNSPSPARDRKFSITSALSIAAHTEGATPNNRVACGLVNLSPGISRYCSRTRCSSASSGAELGGMVIMPA